MSRIAHDLLPWHLLHALDPRNRTTLANAQQASEQIAEAVAERRALQPASAEHVEPIEPHPGGNRRLVTLTEQECRRLLATRSLGRLAFVYRPGIPLILPVNYLVDDGAIFLRSGQGPKLQAAERSDLVSFEVDDIDEARQLGWSVVVTGRARRVRGTDRHRQPAPQPWAPGPRTHLVRIEMSSVSGRWLVDPTGSPGR